MDNISFYFAAANGFGGFKSYFKEIFDTRKFEHIFIIKGGPGTGKSSFMKKIANHFNKKIDACDVILCSADSNSYDGVILTKGDKKIGFLDGTAPHTTDPAIPGACETILNFGNCWNQDLIKKYRKKIENITEAKKENYTYAYKHLHIAGEIDALTKEHISYMVVSKIPSIMIEELSALQSDGGGMRSLIISSFGKNGLYHLDTLEKISEVKYYLTGIYNCGQIAMVSICALLQERGVECVVARSPFDESDIEAIYIPQRKMLLRSGNHNSSLGNTIVDTTPLLDHKRLAESESLLRFLWRERNAWLWSASDYFNRASVEHYELEKIYSGAMDFTAIDNYFSKCCRYIEKTFNIN